MEKENKDKEKSTYDPSVFARLSSGASIIQHSAFPPLIKRHAPSISFSESPNKGLSSSLSQRGSPQKDIDVDLDDLFSSKLAVSSNATLAAKITKDTDDMLILRRIRVALLFLLLFIKPFIILTVRFEWSGYNP
jgi:hypothetical protein